jgi:hypothetical protein
MERYLVDIKVVIQEEFQGENEDEVRQKVEDALEEIPFDIYSEYTITPY